jgi:hypothetical protein
MKISFRQLYDLRIIGLVCILLFAGTGFQSSEHEDKQAQSKKEDKEALTTAQDKYAKALKDLENQIGVIKDKFGSDGKKSQSVSELDAYRRALDKARSDLTVNTVNSPLKVKGGSVHGYAVINFWQKGSANCGKTYSKDEYCVTVPNSYLIASDYFSDDNGKGMKPAPQNTVWKILITSPNSYDGPGSTESVWLCNNSNCDSNQPADPSHVFFMRAQPGNAEWNQPDGHNVYYHNRSGNGCDQITGDEDQDGPCDYILKAKSWVGKNNPTTYTCNVQDSCVIGVGKP